MLAASERLYPCSQSLTMMQTKMACWCISAAKPQIEQVSFRFSSRGLRAREREREKQLRNRSIASLDGALGPPATPPRSKNTLPDERQTHGPAPLPPHRPTSPLAGRPGRPDLVRTNRNNRRTTPTCTRNQAAWSYMAATLLRFANVFFSPAPARRCLKLQR